MQGEIKTTLRRGAALAAVLLLGLPALATEGDDGRRDLRVPPNVPVHGHSNQGGGPVGDGDDQDSSHSNQGRGDPGVGTPGVHDVLREFPDWSRDDGEDTQEMSGGGFGGGPFGGLALGRMDLEIMGVPVAPDPEVLGQGTRFHADPLNMSTVNAFGIDVGSSSNAIRLPGDRPMGVPGPGSLPLLLLAGPFSCPA
jgi:hypothetical protein